MAAWAAYRVGARRLKVTAAAKATGSIPRGNDRYTDVFADTYGPIQVADRYTDVFADPYGDPGGYPDVFRTDY